MPPYSGRVEQSRGPGWGPSRLLRGALVAAVAVGAVLASRTLLAGEPTTGQLQIAEATPGAATPRAAARATPPWSALPAAPVGGREAHTMVWTGEAAIVWGGRGSTPPPVLADRGPGPVGRDMDDPGPDDVRPGPALLSDGAAYDPADGAWTRIARGPLGRADHTAVWTGEQMLVWGGEEQAAEGQGLLRGGEAYDPATDRWRDLPRGPLSGRSLHSAVWTGEEMVVWGGTLDGDETDGAAYDPATDTWRELAPAPLPARAAHAAVWTGGEMVVWGGIGSDGEPTADGAAYDPAADTWRPVPAAPLPGRTQHAMVWDGSRVLVWGGAGTGSAYDDGAAWDPATGTWELLPPAPIAGRIAPVGVWTGRRLVVWGGVDAQLYTDGATYAAVEGWRPLPGAPVASPSRYPGVWTGEQLLVWAGQPPSAAALDLPAG